MNTCIRNTVLASIRLYNRVDNGVKYMVRNMYRIYKSISDSLSEKVFLFFENIPTPYLQNSVHIGSPISAVPSWYYIHEKKCFVEWKVDESLESLMQGTYSLIPILSMELLRGDMHLNDLTEFIDSIIVYSKDNKYPSVAHILGAWSLSSGIVISLDSDVVVRMFDTSANTYDTDVENYHYLNELFSSRDPDRVETGGQEQEQQATGATEASN